VPSNPKDCDDKGNLSYENQKDKQFGGGKGRLEFLSEFHIMNIAGFLFFVKGLFHLFLVIFLGLGLTNLSLSAAQRTEPSSFQINRCADLLTIPITTRTDNFYLLFLWVLHSVILDRFGWLVKGLNRILPPIGNFYRWRIFLHLYKVRQILVIEPSQLILHAVNLVGRNTVNAAVVRR
jgi:hypothetical protein